MQDKFIADVHLGKLAKYMRLVGIDTFYNNSYSVKQIIATAIEEGRIILSRNNSFTSLQNIPSFIVNNEDSKEQLKNVLSQFKGDIKLQPFTRCLICNGLLEAVEKETISHLLEKNTREYYSEFWICSECSHIYWKGSHFAKMLQFLSEIK
ncbi:MAG TPA: Mut7-C RNAse domain-containing protein [Flavisolibacter sp.]|nr:Mut7-C RNAse domain-containing protein [Flavisolibacter sp.]